MDLDAGRRADRRRPRAGTPERQRQRERTEQRAHQEGAMRNAGTTIGRNRTGIATSPSAAADLLEITRQTPPSRPGDEAGMAALRVAYARAGEPPGSMPPPVTIKGMAKSALKLLQGKNAALLLDKLGERLAFERTGARLYEALLSKLEAYGSWPGGPSRAEIE